MGLDDPGERRQLGGQFVADAIATWLGDSLGQSWQYLGDAGGSSHESLVFTNREDSRRVVVRLQPKSGPFPSYDVVAEASLLRWLAEKGLQVPRPLAQDEDGSVCGTPFAVCEWLDGQVLSPGSINSAESARSHLHELLRSLVQIQRTPIHELIEKRAPSIRFRRSFDDVVVDFAAALTGLTSIDTLVLEYARAWLASTRLCVTTAAPVLVHGDFRLGNVVWRPDGTCHVLDWEAAHLGSHLFDVAWMCMGAVAPDDQVMGLATKAEVVALYEELSGRKVTDLELLWWQVAAAWIRGCTEVRLLSMYLAESVSELERGVEPSRDPQELLWEFGSYRTDREILRLIEMFEMNR